LNPDTENSLDIRISWKLIVLVFHKISETWWYSKWACFITRPAPCDTYDSL